MSSWLAVTLSAAASAATPCKNANYLLTVLYVVLWKGLKNINGRWSRKNCREEHEVVLTYNTNAHNLASSMLITRALDLPVASSGGK